MAAIAMSMDPVTRSPDQACKKGSLGLKIGLSRVVGMQENFMVETG